MNIPLHGELAVDPEVYYFDLDLALRAGKTPRIGHRLVSNWGILSVIEISRQLRKLPAGWLGYAGRKVSLLSHQPRI